MTTAEIRGSFLIDGVFVPGAFHGCFTDLDRMVVAGAMPLGAAVALPNHKETGRATFLERRELGAINTGGAGSVTVDGVRHEVPAHACIYVGMGAVEVLFASVDAAQPAKFFILSCPAHAAFPTTVATPDQATRVELGSQSTSNERVIRQYIHENGIQACQLVMGIPSRRTSTTAAPRCITTSTWRTACLPTSWASRTPPATCSCAMAIRCCRRRGRSTRAAARAITSSSGAWPVKTAPSPTWTRSFPRTFADPYRPIPVSSPPS